MPNNKTLVEGGSAIAAIILSVLSIKQVKKYGVLRGDTRSVVAQILLGKVGDVQGISKQIGPNVFLLHKMPWGQSSHNVNILSGFDTANYDYAITAVNGTMRNKMLKEKDDTSDQTVVTSGGSEKERAVEKVFKEIEAEAIKPFDPVGISKSDKTVTITENNKTFAFKAHNEAYGYPAEFDTNVTLSPKAIKACIESHINTPRENLPLTTTTKNVVEPVLDVDPTATSGLQWPFQLQGAVNDSSSGSGFKQIQFSTDYSKSKPNTSYDEDADGDKPNLYELKDIKLALVADKDKLAKLNGAGDYETLYRQLQQYGYLTYKNNSKRTLGKALADLEAALSVIDREQETRNNAGEFKDIENALISHFGGLFRAIKFNVSELSASTSAEEYDAKLNEVKLAIDEFKSNTPIKLNDVSENALNTALVSTNVAITSNESKEATTPTDRVKVLNEFGIKLPLNFTFDSNSKEINAPPPTPSGGKVNLESAIKRAVDANDLTSIQGKMLKAVSKHIFTNNEGNTDPNKKTRSEEILKVKVEALLYEHLKDDGLSADIKHFDYGEGISEKLRALFTAASKQEKTGSVEGMYVIKEKSAPAIVYIKTGEPKAEKSIADSTKNGKIPFTFHKKDALSWKGSSLENLTPNYIQVRNENMELTKIDLTEKKMANQAFFLIVKTPKAGGDETTIRSETWCCNNQVLWALNQLTVPGMDPIYSEGKQGEEEKSE